MLLPGGGYGSDIKEVRHHTIPREILRTLDGSLAGLVRGKAGDANIRRMPENIHKWLHRGRGGGWYNRRWKEEINHIRGGSKGVTEKQIRAIRVQSLEEAAELAKEGSWRRYLHLLANACDKRS